MSSQGVAYDGPKEYGTVRIKKEIALKGWFEYGTDPEGRIVNVRISTRHGISIIPIQDASIDQKKSRSFHSEVTEDDIK